MDYRDHQMENTTPAICSSRCMYCGQLITARNVAKDGTSCHAKPGKRIVPNPPNYGTQVTLFARAVPSGQRELIQGAPVTHHTVGTGNVRQKRRSRASRILNRAGVFSRTGGPASASPG